MERKSASALSYGPGMAAPQIVAHGRGELADRILEIARDHGIAIVKNPLLADILDDTEIGACVPPETWEAVAAIFAFLERGTEQKWFS